jgi:hypothetical protein
MKGINAIWSVNAPVREPDEDNNGLLISSKELNFIILLIYRTLQNIELNINSIYLPGKLSLIK